MKRFLLGATCLAALAATGSAGAYFAYRGFLAGEPANNDVAATTAPVAREMAPTPIPIAQQTPSPDDGQDDPFVARRPHAHRTPHRIERHEPAESDTPVNDEGARLDDAALDSEPVAADALEASEGEIPDADESAVPARDVEMPSTPAGEPFSARQRSGRFAEQQAAAQLVEDEVPERTAEERPELRPVEPRPLSAKAATQSVDRYGRPLNEAAPPRTARRAPAREEEPPVAEPAAAEETAGTPDQAEASDDSAEGTGRPGDPQLSGSQAPALTIEKTAPPEIQIGKPAKFLIKVRNAGSAVAQGVEIHDTIPQGTQLIDAVPPANRGPQGALIWELGALKPGEEQKVELQLMPLAEGEIGSVATVHFRAEASVRTLATKPMLNLEVTGPDQVMKGQSLALKIKISNPGSGAANDVVLTENVPEGLTHPSGKELELEIGTLKPGETREMQLDLTAAAAGQVINVLNVRGDGNLKTEVQTAFEVIAPQLAVSMSGPKRRYLERNATHNISISNPGTAAAKDIELVAVLPKELKFVEANNGGQFDAATHSVYWSLEELPPQETGTVTLTTLPLAAGDARLLIKTTGQQNLADQREEVVAIEGLAAINFQLADTSDPIEAGGQTTYEVRVTNQGTKAASNVRLVAVVPREMKPISAEGPVRFKIESQRVIFEPLKQLAPKADTSFKIKVQALEAGDLRLQVQVSTDEIREPITKEESTRVFGDE